MIHLRLIKKGQLVREAANAAEIDGLIDMIERDLKDSLAQDLSEDWRFGIAYNAALKLATILVRDSGYRVRGTGFHLNTIQLLPHFLGKKYQSYADYLEACRCKRNALEYDSVGGVSQSEVQELQDFVREFQQVVMKHLEREK